MNVSNNDTGRVTDIAFVFDNVRNYKSLVNAFRPGVEVHVLDANQNGLEQIAALLDGRGGIGALHVVAHGAPGQLSLGTMTLDAGSLVHHAAALAAIGSALAGRGDILLYGCDIAAGALGATFAGLLARATGADVAASTDPTGGSIHGGDWALEYHAGDVGANGAFDAAAVHSLDTLLALPASGVQDVTEAMNKQGAGSFLPAFTLTSVHEFLPDPTEGADGIYFYSDADQDTSTVDATLTVSADNSNLGSFDLTALDLEKYPGGAPGEYTITVTGYKPDSTTVVTSFRSERDATGYSTLPNFSSFTGIVKFDLRIVSTGSPEYAGIYPVSNWTFDGFSIANPRAPNAVTVFLGGSSLNVTQSSGAVSLSSLLHVSDTDSYQTLTWSQSSAPSHGTLSFTGATAAGGSSDITPGGSITYAPAAGYIGSDSFTVQVFDGFQVVTKTISVNVAIATPGTPDLGSGSDSGTSTTDNRTNAGSLDFMGTGAAGDSSSTVRVFIDKNGNGAYDSGTDPSATATMSNGTWSVPGLSSTGLVDGSYNVYAVTSTGASTSPLSPPLSVTIDKTGPTVAVTSSKPSLKAGETAAITFTFSEDPGASFILADAVVSGGTLTSLSGSGATRTATFTPSPNASGMASITVGAASYTDSAGNSGSSGSLPSIAFDTLAPTLAITSDKSTLKAGQTATITYTFSEDPGTSFTDADVTVTGGTISAISGSGTTRTATFTPSAGTNSGVASISVASGAYTDAAGNGGGAGSTPSLSFDTLAPAAPTLALSAGSDTGTSSSDGVSNDTTPTFTGTAEAGATVSLYDTDGVTLLGSATADGSGNWSVTSSALPAGTHLVSVRATDAAGNQGAASAAYTLLVDSTAPTLTISSDVSTLDLGDTAIITFTFSEDPGATFTDGDIAVSGGTLGALSGTGNTRTAVFTPAANSAGTASITVSPGSYTDAAGNAGGAGTTPVISYDTTAPTLAITTSASALKAGETATITFTFSADPGSSFTHDDIAVSGGTLGTLSGSGLTRTATFTPDANTQSGSASITVAAGAYDDGTNGGLAAGSPSMTFDTLAPTLAITSNAATLKAGEVATISFTFSEDPGASFTDADIAVTGGTLGTLSGTGNTRTATFTPDASTNGGVAGISVASGQYSDSAGNPGAAGTTPPLTFDTLAPAASSVPDLDGGSDSGTSDSDNITSDNTPTIGGTAEDGATVTLYDGAAMVGTAVATGGAWSITSSALAAGAHALTTTVTDAAGNVSAASAALSITVDTSAPALAISSDAAQLKAGETATLTFTFSEDPGATFDMSDIAVSGGTLGALSGTGLTRTAVFTPAPDTDGGSASISVAAGAYTDAAGNAGGEGTPPSLAFDTLPPQVAITSDVPALKTGEVATITFTFSEDPGASFAHADISVTGGTLGALAGTGSTRTATFTPDASTNDGVATITIAPGAYTDAAGNGGGAGLAPVLVFDTLAPSASSQPDLSAASDSGTAGNDNITSHTTPAFTGTAEDGATVTLYDGATVVGTAVATGGVWSITSSALSDGAHALASTVTDAAGNVSAASAALHVTIDTSAPTLAITSDVASLKAGETATITFTFSEDPGATFTAADLTVSGGTLGALSGTGTTRTATFTPAADTNGGTASIAVASGRYTDAAGNEGAAGSSPSLSFDTLAPTLSISSDTAALKAGEVATVTFTFSEDPGVSFALADVTVSGGTLSALAGSGTTRIATFTPDAGTDGGTASISVTAGSYTDAAGNNGAAGAAPGLAFDTLAPAATAVDLAAASDSGASDSDDITAGTTPTFTGAAENGATVTLYQGSTVLGTAVASSGAWSITSTALADGVHNLTAVVVDAAGNSSAVSAPLALTVDTAGPTLAITSDAAALKAGETATVTFTFSEDPGASFSAAGIAVAGGTLGALSGTGTTRTATFTPSAGSTGSASVTVAAGAYTDAAGNSGGAASMPAIPIDTLAPTLTISSDPATLKAGQAATITFSFSEDPGASFTAADIAVTGGTLGTLSGSGTTRTATFTPDANTNGGAASITVASGSYADAAGNGGAAGAAPSLTFDTQVPAAPAAPDLAAADDSGTSDSDNITSDSTPTFSGTAEDGATVSLYDGAALAGTAVAAGGTWSITSGALSGGTHAITAVVTDAAGNASASSPALSVTVDTAAPTAAITSSASALRAGQTATITITFSEDPGASFTDADLVVSGGTLGALSGTGAVRTATFTPAPAMDGASAAISLAAGLYADTAGNSGAAATLSIAVDTSAPAAPAPALVSDSATPGDRITNSGAVQVSGLEAGAAWEYSTNGGGSWNPGSGTQLMLSGDGMHALLVRQTDSAGNTGPASAPLVFTLDTQGPTASVSISDSSLTTGETATVTITFDEAVDDFSLSDIAAPFGSLSGLASSDGGLTWTATYTPDAAVLHPDARIVVSNTGVSDAAGNTGSGTSASGSFSVQTAGIGARIEISDTELLAGETAQVTIVFNEAVTGFSGADLAAGSGSLSNLSSADGGRTWTATLTPASSVADASNVITLDYSGVTGPAGLPGAGVGTSGNYSVNTVRPTAMLALADTMLAPGESTGVTISFSEPVAGFSFADVMVLSGTLSGLSSADGGRTWTTILTADPGTAKMGGVALNLAGVQNLAGNSGTGAVTAKFYTIPAAATPASVDGAATYSQHTAGSNGTPGKVVTVVLPTAPDRTDDPASPHGSLADIPLGLPSGAGNSLMVGLPARIGLQAEGPSVPLSQPQALEDLIGRIEGGTQPGSPTQQQMAAHGSSFLSSLAGGVTVESRTLTLTADAGATPGTPIAITGAAPGQGGSVVGLVIDGTGLPAGSTLQLDNVEFAAVVGDLRLVGGAGRNYVVGDGGSQTIYLGAEDDSLFGGAGNDIIGSAGGDDLLDGGAGDDLVAGGVGSDRLLGGEGDDILNGGRSTTGSWDFYLAANGAITARHTAAALTLTGSELVAAAEFDRSLPELSFLGAHAAQLEGVALLYAALGRAPDVAGLSFWSRTGIVSLRDVADGVLRSAEWGGTPLGQSGDAQFVRGMYQDLLGREVDDAGFAFWTANLASGRATRSDVLMAVAFSGEHKGKALTAHGYLIAHADLANENGWIGASGDDRLQGGAGNDLLVGGDGFDTAVYAGQAGEYQFAPGADGLLRVVHLATGDTDILSGIEAAEFADGTFELASLVGQAAPGGEG